MSKKKGSGSTMTLKDFHGGSIPTDLRLPSAPGVITKPSDRPVFERQVSWGNPMGRSDQRPLRPGSAGSIRNFDDKTPFLSPSTHIGRNFDEDERTPLDGVSGPRRMVSDESTRQFPMHTELKPEYSSTGRSSSRPISSPSSHASSYAGRIAEASHVGANNPHSYARTGSYSGRSSEPANVDVGGSRGHSSSSSGYPNAWGIRKEVVTAPEPVPAARPGPNDAFKLAHASALDKISSGRWQSKLGHPQTDVEVIKHTVVESEIHPAVDHFNSRGSYNAPNKVGEMVYQEAALVRHAERSLNVVDGTRSGGREFPTYEQPKSPMLLKAIDNNSPVYVDGSQADQSDHHFARSESRSPVPVDHSERPKLKLLPRSKPLESSGSFVDNKQVYQQPRNFDHMEIVHEADVVINPTKPALAGSEGGNQAVERPKLNIKPRSQPIEQFERNIDRSNTVFGAARPRELVLKERGVDDVAVSNQDRVQPPTRVKQDFPRTEPAPPTHSTPIRYNERTENDNRLRKNDDRRDNNRVEAEKTDVQRRSWRNDNWRNNRETEQQHHQQQQQRQQERPPSPETWRKPSEQPRPGSSGGQAPPRYGKGASAVELAQAFSRPASDPKLGERLPGQRSIVPGGGQVPFSRLMDQNSRPRINGY